MTNARPETIRVRRETQSVKTARAFVISSLKRTGAPVQGETKDARLEDLELLTSELVANAVLHGLGEVEVRVGCDEGLARVEVHDDDPDLPAVAPPTPGATAGRGLAIVNAMADRWGCISRAGVGKTVWFELDLARPIPPFPTIY